MAALPDCVVRAIGRDGDNLAYDEGWSMINMSMTLDEVEAELVKERRLYVLAKTKMIVFDLIEVMVWLVTNPNASIRSPYGEVWISAPQKVIIHNRGKEYLTKSWKDFPSMLEQIEDFFRDPKKHENSILTHIIQLNRIEPTAVLDMYIQAYNKLHTDHARLTKAYFDMSATHGLLLERDLEQRDIVQDAIVQFTERRPRERRRQEPLPNCPAVPDPPAAAPIPPPAAAPPPPAAAAPVRENIQQELHRLSPHTQTVIMRATTERYPEEIDEHYLEMTTGRVGYTVDQLKHFCRLRGLPVSGTKAQLRDRLLTHLRSH